MKKNELNQLVIGSSIESKKTGEVLVINNIVEVEGKVKYQLSNDKSTTQSSLLRWYNLIPQEQEVVEQVEVEEVIPETTVEDEEIQVVEDTPTKLVTRTPIGNIVVEVEPEVEPVVEVKPKENMSTVEHLHFLIVKYCTTHDYKVKYNSDHIAIKGNKKNLIELYQSKKAINIAVRHQLFTEEEQMVLDNCRIVGNGTYVLDLKFQIHSLDEFIDALTRAVQYIPAKSKK